MAVVASQRQREHLRGLVDMGSNGIRFSISTLQPPTARVMPTLHQHRAGISLYDAQYSADGQRQPISSATISDVITAFRQFKQTCQDFQVPDELITVLATEATRTAINSEDFRKQIKDQIGWDVTMLPKEEEGRVGAMGIASSLPEASGLVMDLGGGSTQLSWLIKKSDASGIQMPSTGAVSMPYGAAAMSRRLQEAQAHGTLEDLTQEIRSAVKAAYASLNVPIGLQRQAEEKGGYSLYLSGGGFRGWGYVLMSQHRIKPYPIPIINGLAVSREDFLATNVVQAAAAAALDEEDDDIFRVSDRRASQVPAVALLITAISEALPQISEIRFCQGGVREGFLFSSLTSEIRAQHPLVVATQPFDDAASSERIVDLLLSAFPPESSSEAQDDYKSTFNRDLLDAFANMMYYHSSHTKDIQASAALHSTITGILASVHGVLHESRAILALLLCARWGAAVPPNDNELKRNLELLVGSPWTLWWINYIGTVASFISTCYPAGIVSGTEDRLSFQTSWASDAKGRSQLDLEIRLAPGQDTDALVKEVKAIEKVGKPKRWIGGKDGIGHKVTAKLV